MKEKEAAKKVGEEIFVIFYVVIIIEHKEGKKTLRIRQKVQVARANCVFSFRCLIQLSRVSNTIRYDLTSAARGKRVDANRLFTP